MINMAEKFPDFLDTENNPADQLLLRRIQYYNYFTMMMSGVAAAADIGRQNGATQADVQASLEMMRTGIKDLAAGPRSYLQANDSHFLHGFDWTQRAE